MKTGTANRLCSHLFSNSLFKKCSTNDSDSPILSSGLWQGKVSAGNSTKCRADTLSRFLWFTQPLSLVNIMHASGGGDGVSLCPCRCFQMYWNGFSWSWFTREFMTSDLGVQCYCQSLPRGIWRCGWWDQWELYQITSWSAYRWKAVMPHVVHANMCVSFHMDEAVDC